MHRTARLVSALFAALALATTLGARSAHAQSATTGAIHGKVIDKKTKEPIIGVTVIVTSTERNVSEIASTDESGAYKIDNLPPGDYMVTFSHGEQEITQDHVRVGPNRAVGVFQKMSDATEVIRIVADVPDIDTTTPAQVSRLPHDVIKILPGAGGTQAGAALVAAGTSNDGAGVAVAGSTAYENRYFLDGSDVTALQFGGLGAPVLSDFLEEVEVITGAYNAEYGRSTGGFINAVTRTGSNELHGSVFGYVTPGALVAARDRTPSQTSPIDAQRDLTYQTDIGFDLGGPILRDKAWFYVGFSPSFTRYDTTRRIQRRTDCRVVMDNGELSECDRRSPTEGGFADSVPDIDPDTGLYVTEQLDQSKIASTGFAASVLAKLNVAVSPEHQGQVSFITQPQSGTDRSAYGLPASTTRDYEANTTDISTKWSSKFHDNKTEVQAVFGLHRATYTNTAREDAMNAMPGQVLRYTDLGSLSSYGGESPLAVAGCADDDIADPYPFIANCPDEGTGYRIGGAGALVDDFEERRSLRLDITRRQRFLGSHELKAGVDIEDNTLSRARLLSGGAFLDNAVRFGQIDAIRWVQIAPPQPGERFDNTCTDDITGEDYTCDFLSGDAGSPGTDVTGRTLNWAAFVRDSWQLRPNLVIDAGLRYEEQRLRYAEELQHTVDPLTGNALGTNAMVLKNMLAPRIGLVYDWTEEGRSRLYGHWGRFYESIPMQINDLSFGGEVQYVQTFAANQCGMAGENGITDGGGCLNDPGLEPAGGGNLFGSSGVLVAPDLKAQYMDETIIGAEMEIASDTKIGISYQHRSLGRVIEDVSTDGASTYVIANPGEWSGEAEDDLEEQIARAPDEETAMRLQQQLDMFRGIRLFDKPKRDHDAVTITLSRRLSRGLFVQASYVYARTRGNYPGLLSYDNGQSDPNISSQYDLIELLANRQGPLPQDRPHAVKLDVAKVFSLGKIGAITLSGRARATSGAPIDVLGAHYAYGPDESFILPRGAFGRTSFEHGIDVHIAYGRSLGKGVAVEVFADLFNLYNRQGTFAVDETYALDLPGNAVNPIVGGTYEDVIWAKGIDQNGGESETPIVRNPNFRNTTVHYAPFSARFGARLTF
jgi:outer membrane receptor protein involved in Fe transport